jgi:hypothetical protein
MTTEWLALWCPFLVFGSLTMVFCMTAWKQIGILLPPTTQPASRVATGVRETMKQRHRLLRIALMISVCLLLNTIATLSVSSKLDEWSRTADLSLVCSAKETWNSRDWDAYGFDMKGIVNVCSASEVTFVNSFGGCASDCAWDPSQSQDYLKCKRKVTGGDGAAACGCPCSSLVQVERPSVGMLTLAHVSQSLVVVIVGLNLGFRKKNLEVWKAFFRARVLTHVPGGTIMAVLPIEGNHAFEFDSKAYDNE